MAYFTYQGKQVYYASAGAGRPCLFLHGNTASSRMFDLLLPLYTPFLRAVTVDFLGNGRSDRVEAFPNGLWADWGRQVIGLAQALDCGPVDLVGTSGGAYAAINAALERPDLFRRVVADSFDGGALPPGFTERVLAERNAAKQDPQARDFYAWCQGPDWERVVDLDTQALAAYEREQIPPFLAPIEQIRRPLLITVSRTDRMLAGDLAEECRRLQKANPGIQCRIYPDGDHPLILSRAEEIAAEIRSFLKS